MRYLPILIFCCGVLALPAGAAGQGADEITDPSRFPSLISAVRLTGPIDLCGERVPIDEPEVRERLEKELLLSVWNRAQIVLWLKRSGRYMPYIEKMLRENGLPDDLKYAAVVESSLLPHIGSHAGAVGYWQFIRSTAVRYGLKVDRDFDDRRNIFSSTLAAIRYFQKLHAEFNSWTLSVAAYNMGEAGLRRRIKSQGTDNFYHLYLPQETQRHILKIVAVKLILSNPRKYGFHFTAEDLYEPAPADRVQVRCPQEVPIRLIADAANTYFKKIKDLNPEIRGYDMPVGTHSILVPRGSGKGFSQRFAEVVRRWEAEQEATSRSEPGRRVHVVSRGDNLSRIAERYGVALSDLIRWNNLSRSKPIYPGQRLVIHGGR